MVPHTPPVSGVRKAKLEHVVVPELATLVASAPEGAGWLHELKFDGYGLMARLEGGHPSFRGLREDKSAAEAVPEPTEATP